MTEALALCDGESAQCLGSIARAELHVDAITLVYCVANWQEAKGWLEEETGSPG